MSKTLYKSALEVVDNDWSYMPSRLLYPSAFIDSMPSKTISYEELYEKKCLAHFNSPEYYGYPEEYFLANYLLRENEVGHDYAYRYIISGSEEN